MYASKEQFAGQRASIGRDVVVGTDRGPRWGKIVEVDPQRGACLFVPPIGLSAKVEGATFGYEFKETKTEQDVEALGQFEWTWPVRV
jgi:hypothetical protein